MILNYITWNISPIIFEIGKFQIRWYSLLFAFSFIIGYIIMNKIYRKEKLHEQLLDKLTIYVFLGTIIGARLGHVFFYEPQYFMENPWEILKVWHGGLASHGAAIGIIIALWLYSKKTRLPFIWTLDRIVIVVAFAGVLIRLGNLFNSEIYGDLTNLPWGFIFVKDGQTEPRHPTQIYEAIAYFLIFLFLIKYYFKKGTKSTPGFLFGYFLVLLFSVRFLIEFVKEPQVDFETYMTLNMGQILSIPFIILGIIILTVKPKVSKKEIPNND